MKEKKINKLKILTNLKVLFVISLLITMFFISTTYSKYYEEMNTNYDIDMMRWNIKLNEEEIQNITDLTKIMQPTFIENENIEENIIAPGRKGYFDIIIDYSQVDIPFKFELNIQQTGENKLTDFKVYGYSIVEKEESEIIESDKISHIINPNETKEGKEKKEELKIYFKWNDDEDNNMNNIQDTQFRGEENNEGKNTILRYSVNLRFSQYLEE